MWSLFALSVKRSLCLTSIHTWSTRLELEHAIKTSTVQRSVASIHSSEAEKKRNHRVILPLPHSQACQNRYMGKNVATEDGSAAFMFCSLLLNIWIIHKYCHRNQGKLNCPNSCNKNGLPTSNMRLFEKKTKYWYVTTFGVYFKSTSSIWWKVLNILINNYLLENWCIPHKISPKLK